MGVGSSTTTRWDGSQIPSQRGKVAIVTGGNSGIGYFTARALAQRGAHVVLACRSDSRGRAAAKELNKFVKEHADPADAGRAEFLQVDLSNLASVREFAQAFRRRFDRLDLLVNNAGVALPPQPLTADGFEMQFGVNHLSHFLLTASLLDLLKASPAARVVTVSSLAHRRTESLEIDTLAKGTDNQWARYGKSKLANLLFAYELQRRLDTAKISNVMSVAAHPGVSYTPIADKLIEAIFPKFARGVVGWIVSLAPINSSEMGALPTLYAATVETVAGGDYYGPDGLGGRRGYPVKEESRGQSHSKEAAASLWGLSEEILGERFEI